MFKVSCTKYSRYRQQTRLSSCSIAVSPPHSSGLVYLTPPGADSDGNDPRISFTRVIQIYSLILVFQQNTNTNIFRRHTNVLTTLPESIKWCKCTHYFLYLVLPLALHYCGIALLWNYHNMGLLSSGCNVGMVTVYFGKSRYIPSQQPLNVLIFIKNSYINSKYLIELILIMWVDYLVSMSFTLFHKHPLLIVKYSYKHTTYCVNLLHC
jgi:hypothetical protein